MILVGAIVLDDRYRAGGRDDRAGDRALQREAGIEQSRTARIADPARRSLREEASCANDDVVDATRREIRIARDQQGRRRRDIRRRKAGADRELEVRIAGPRRAVVAGRQNPVGHYAVAAWCGQVDTLAEVRVAGDIALPRACAD